MSLEYITNHKEADLRGKRKHGHAVNQYTKELLALRFYAGGNFLQVVGDTVGVHKATVSQAAFSAGNIQKLYKYINLINMAKNIYLRGNPSLQIGGTSYY